MCSTEKYVAHRERERGFCGAETKQNWRERGLWISVLMGASDCSVLMGASGSSVLMGRVVALC